MIFYRLENADDFGGKINESLHCAEEYCEYFQTSEEAYRWLLRTNIEYIDRRYGGISVNESKVAVWYNNKGYHSMPSYLNELNSALLKTELNDSEFKITTFNHPLTLGRKEQSITSLYDLCIGTIDKLKNCIILISACNK